MAIKYQTSHPQYYKRLSDFQMSADCCFNSDGEFDIVRVRSLMLRQENCEEHNHGYSPTTDAVVKTAKYPGFSIVALGVPRNIWLPDLASFELMRRDLKFNNHLLMYWDTTSVAIITDKTQWTAALEEFLTLAKFFRHIEGAGLYISL